MFKIQVPITKSTKSKDGKTLSVEGIASSPAIDAEEERFSPQAIAKMCETVNSGGIPIRAEHQNKFYTEVGKWKSADLDVGNFMYVKGDIDLEMSLGRDIETLLKRGANIALSVGGRVVSAGYEYSKELGKNVRVYKEIVLDEISVVLNPANYDAKLSLAKSIDWAVVTKSKDSAPYTTEAKRLITLYKSMEHVTEDEFRKKLLTSEERNKLPDSAFAYVATVDGKKVRKLPIHDAAHAKNAMAVLGGARGGVKGIPASEMAKVKAKVEAAAKKFGVGMKKKSLERPEKLTKFLSSVIPKVQEAFDKCEMCEPSEASMGGGGLSTADLMLVAKLMKIMQSVPLPTDEEVNAAYSEDSEFFDGLQNIGEDAYIIMSGGGLSMPHHNADYTVNKDWVLIRMKQLVDQQGYMTPKDFSLALNHLYQHLKEMQLVKSANSKKINVRKSMLTKKDIALLEACYKFQKNEVATRPAAEGQELSDDEIAKGADAFTALGSSGKLLQVLKAADAEATEETATEETAATETEAEATETETTEETAAEAESEEVAEEEVAKETEEVAPAAEGETEEAEAETVEAPAEEAAPEATETASPAPEAAQAEGEVAKALKGVQDSVTKSVKDMATQIAKSAKSQEAVVKSVSDLATIVKGLQTKATEVDSVKKSVEEISKAVEMVVGLVDKMASAPLGRKSVARQIIEKNGASDESGATGEDVMKSKIEANMAKGMPWAQAYAAAKAEVLAPQS